MTDVASPPGEHHPQISGPPSALRSSRSKPRRVPTRVSIVAPTLAPPRGSTPADAADATVSPRSVAAAAGSSSAAAAARPVLTPPGLRVASTTWKRLILTLDGGGIRGYSSLVILRALMREIARLEQTLDPPAAASTHTDRIPRDQIPDDVYRDGQYLPCHYFDYIAGTSVGGLIAIMLGMFGQGVDDCIAEFHRQNKAIPVADDASVVSSIDFPLLYRRSTWPTKRTRSFFDTFAKFAVTATSRSLTGDSATPSLSPASSQSSASSAEFRKDTYQCQTLAWCTEVEARRSRKPYAFCTYAEDDNDDAEDGAAGGSSEPAISIPEVAKAITTPSRYSFKPFKLGSGQFVDGSKQVRDPTLQVMKEITSLLDEAEPPIDLLLSLGTDEHQAWFYEKLRHFTLSQPAAAATTSSSPTPSATPSPSTPSPTTTTTTTRTPTLPRTSTDHEAITSEHGRSYNHYTRLSVPNIKLGFRKKHFLREIEAATEAWLAEPAQVASVARHARQLVEKRRARAATARWESFALGVRYVCFHEGCVKKRRDGEGEGQVFTSRGDFFDHLERRHGLMKMKARGAVDVEAELDRGRRFGCT